MRVRTGLLALAGATLGLILTAGTLSAGPARPDLDSPAARARLSEFKIDSKLACRFPVAFEGFRATGDLSGPSIDELCPSFDVVSERGEHLRLEPKHLFEVQYLVAGRGGGFASRFGHAMLRLVFCAPDRDGVSTACRKDTFHAVDVGFAAHTDTQTFSIVGGVTGRYPSWLSITPDPDLRVRYVDQELRELVAWPLALSPEAKRTLLALIVERHWAYDGRYKFLSNNCADEILKVLQASLPATHALVKNDPDVITPLGLYQQLVKANLVGEDSFRTSSRRPAMDEALRRLSLDPVARTTKAYLNAPADVRRAWVQSSARHHVALFTALEDVARREARARLTRATIDALYKADEEPGACPRTRTEMRSSLEQTSARLSPTHFRTDDPRGVPDAAAVRDEDAIAARHAEFAITLIDITKCFAHVPQVARASAEVAVALDIERRLQRLMFTP